MRLTKIRLTGYSRFHEAECNVDGSVIAFVGPNEAGKSTLLRALEWLTSPSSQPLEAFVRNRDEPPADYDVAVRGIFLLSAEEIQAVRDLSLDTEENLDEWTGVRLIVERRADGSPLHYLTPTLHRNLKPVESAMLLVKKVRAAWSGSDEVPGDVDLVESALANLTELLDVANTEWSADRANSISTWSGQLFELANTLAEDAREGEGDPEISTLFDLTDALGAVETLSVLPPPDQAALQLLVPLVPRFLLFGEDDRRLPASFDVVNDPAVPIALANLLAVANSSAALIGAAIARGPSARLTMEQTLNQDLAVVGDYWSQNSPDGKKLQPYIGVNVSGVIDVGISDGEGITAINERSEGLQTYLALISFLLSKKQDGDRTILLIDEAERNLHYDAQGDLVRLLTNDLPVAQVLYTTHSPGCLPLDLGTGIRVVARSSANVRDSVLLDNFWTEEQPGFSRLLLAMGAGAAAFSAINRALLTEGVSEMILLPHLLRKADPTRKLDFQVSFGLSNMSIPKDLGDVALRTTYLVDGDREGSIKLAKLKRAGVPESNRLQLRDGEALEDLLDRDFYLDAVDAVIRETPDRDIVVDRALLATDQTIAKAVDLLERSVTGFKAPGHKLVAARIAANPCQVAFAPGAEEYLRETLLPQIATAFSAEYHLAASKS